MPFELQDMLPGSPLDDGVNAVFADSIFSCQWPQSNLTIGVSHANLFDLIRCQFRKPLSLSLRQPVSLESILCVVFERADLKVIGPHARRLVAFVTNHEPFRHRSVMQFIRENVCRSIVCSFAKTKAVVAAGIKSVPEPTTIAFDDMAPEPRLTRSAASFIMTSLAAIATTSIFYARLLLGKLLSALLADNDDPAQRIDVFQTLHAAKLAASISEPRTGDGKLKITVLANYVDSGTMAFRHESKPLISICVQRPANVTALVGLAAL